ncbi:MAG: DNA repair protein RecN [Oscillospiraceae bacterium]|nr:DNA repair protein RecN [Oscillospiraceae bacterium]
MLEALHSENIAVIEKAEIDFCGGFNVLTGETGAGKSIVIDALAAVTGGRTSRELVRSGENGASVTAVFTGSAETERWLSENGLEPESDGRIFILRRIQADGKNVCRINGCPVAVAQLRELGALLIDIHGQNDGRKLLDEATHLSYLDGFAGLSGEVAAYGERYAALRAKEREIEALTMDEGEKERRTDMLKYQIDELERADVHIGEMAEKQARRDLLKNSAKLTDAVDEAFSALYGGDSSDGIVTLAGEAESALLHAARYSKELDPLCERLHELKCTADDLAEELRTLLGDLNFSPEELDELEDRLSKLGRLSRKYGGDEEQMLAFLENAKKELESIEYSSDMIIKLEKERDALVSEAQAAAAALSEKRRAAAKSLEKRIKDELLQLNMASVQFEVEFSPLQGEYGLGPAGCDSVSFLMSANAGEKPGRISRIASGGELSRIMLAMKNVMAESDPVGTMVFDEIDTGVSGVAAQRVGEKIAALSAARQVMCVTHLPQIAVMADAHYEVRKEQSGGRTYTYVNQLDVEGRKREIARLTGGENVTETTLRSAEEQLAAADRFKKSRGT